MSDLQDELDCYGWLHDPYLVPCRDKCAVRFLCKDELKKRLEQMGPEKVKNRQEEIIMANENEVRKEVVAKEEKKTSVDPQVSPLVSEVIALFGTLGLKTIQRRGYVAFKIDNRNIFSINKMKATKLPDIIKFVFHKNLEDFPKELQPFVSPEKISGFHCVKVETVAELEGVVKQYLEMFKG